MSGHDQIMSQNLVSSLKQSVEFIKRAKLKEALLLLRTLTKDYPEHDEPWSLLGELLMQREDSLQEALQCFQKSLTINPKNPLIYLYRGLVYERLEDAPNAFEAYRQALTINPNYPDALHCVGRILKKDRQNIAALHYMSQAYNALQNNVIINSDLGYVCNSLGFSKEAIKYYAKAFELEPASKQHLSSLIFLYHKDSSKTLADLLEIAKKYNALYINKQPVILHPDHRKRYLPNKQVLRLGFVSGDFHTHPVAYNLLAVFQRLNRSNFEIYIYHNETKHDAVTEKFEVLANKYTKIDSISNLDAAKLIAKDEVDILFDLSGYTLGERLEIFKHKPAPLQVSHLGFFGTLGIPEIDFLLADNSVVKPGEERFYVENIYKFPVSYNHCDLYGIPEHNVEAPCMRNGYITLGSFNTFHKISFEVINTWIEVLQRVPESRILIDSRSLQSKTDIDYFRSMFVNKGIGAERVDIRSNASRSDFLNSYNDVDISLDPFPFTGGTTTLESLLMGVPLVTWEGDKWSSRLSSTTLQAIGHSELIAYDKAEYINKLVELAGDKQRIQNYRNSLKNTMLNSDLHIDKYVANFETALREMWRIKCAE